MQGFHRHLDAAITWARYQGARLRTRGQDPGLIAQYRATSPDQVFTIVGSGGTVNDLSEEQCLLIEAGVSASINMAGVAPIAFDILSIESIQDTHQAQSLALKLRTQSKPAIFWYQNRSKHDNELIRALRAEFPTHAYTRASVSVRRRLDSFLHVFRTVMRPRVFETPDLNISFALTGSVARLVLLALSLGYRRIAFVGIDLGSTRYFWQEGVEFRGRRPWQDVHGTFDPSPSATSFQGAGGRVVPSLFELLRCLHEESPEPLTFTTIDPMGRSRLTEFLRDDLYGAGQGAVTPFPPPPGPDFRPQTDIAPAFAGVWPQAPDSEARPRDAADAALSLMPGRPLPLRGPAEPKG